MYRPGEGKRREAFPRGSTRGPVEGPPPRKEAARSDVPLSVVRAPGGFAFVKVKSSSERT